MVTHSHSGRSAIDLLLCKIAPRVRTDLEFHECPASTASTNRIGASDSDSKNPAADRPPGSFSPCSPLGMGSSKSVMAFSTDVLRGAMKVTPSTDEVLSAAPTRVCRFAAGAFDPIENERVKS
jgi:hypothetical protein